MDKTKKKRKPRPYKWCPHCQQHVSDTTYRTHKIFHPEAFEVSSAASQTTETAVTTAVAMSTPATTCTEPSWMSAAVPASVSTAIMSTEPIKPAATKRKRVYKPRPPKWCPHCKKNVHPATYGNHKVFYPEAFQTSSADSSTATCATISTTTTNSLAATTSVPTETRNTSEPNSTPYKWGPHCQQYVNPATYSEAFQTSTADSTPSTTTPIATTRLSTDTSHTTQLASRTYKWCPHCQQKVHPTTYGRHKVFYPEAFQTSPAGSPTTTLTSLKATAATVTTPLTSTSATEAAVTTSVPTCMSTATEPANGKSIIIVSIFQIQG